MPSKKKSKGKAGKKGGANGAAKKADGKHKAPGDHMQRLKISGDPQDDEDAFLEEAIKLATAEKEANDAADVQAAALHEENLFKTPAASDDDDDCPICCIPFPENFQMRQYQVCCGKYLCMGCISAHWSDRGELDCPFCRTVATESDEEYVKLIQKRVAVNDAEAISFLACKYSGGDKGLPQDHGKAISLWIKASELGSAAAFRNIAAAYHDARGVRKNPQKEKHYHEMAAIRGYNSSRSVLGTIEWNDRNLERAYKHWTIAAEAGNTESLKELQEGVQLGYVTGSEYARIVRCYQKSLDEAYSEQRVKSDKSLRDVAAALGINDLSTLKN